MVCVSFADHVAESSVQRSRAPAVASHGHERRTAPGSAETMTATAHAQAARAVDQTQAPGWKPPDTAPSAGMSASGTRATFTRAFSATCLQAGGGRFGLRCLGESRGPHNLVSA